MICQLKNTSSDFLTDIYSHKFCYASLLIKLMRQKIKVYLKRMADQATILQFWGKRYLVLRELFSFDMECQNSCSVLRWSSLTTSHRWRFQLLISVCQLSNTRSDSVTDMFETDLSTALKPSSLPDFCMNNIAWKLP